MLTITDLSLQRGGVWLLESVSLTVQLGQRVAIVGANGAGKSSLFQLLLGQLAPEQGADMIVAHDKRHTDWNEGPKAEFRDGSLYLYSRFDEQWVEYPMRWVGSLNPSHSGGGVEVQANSTLGEALGDIGF